MENLTYSLKVPQATKRITIELEIDEATWNDLNAIPNGFFRTMRNIVLAGEKRARGIIVKKPCGCGDSG